MSHNSTNMYDIDSHIAELYDGADTYVDDVTLIGTLIAGSGPLRILEPFCGTGRLLIPLAMDGHTLVGVDQAQGMLSRARLKIGRLPETVQARIALTHADAVRDEWPRHFDLVILGSNCFYELATPQEQERCIEKASTALIIGGHVYVDNDHMEGELAPSWQEPGARPCFPTGVCEDGTAIESHWETVWCDVPNRLARLSRRTTVTLPDGKTVMRDYVQQKHPVSTGEVQRWLEAYGFKVERLYGDRNGADYTQASIRAIFWATKS